MKILLLTTHLNKGGIAFYTVNLAKYARKSGADVSVLSSGGELESLLKKQGIDHIKRDIKTKFEFGHKVWKALPEVIRIVKQGSFDIIHAQTRVAQVLSAMVSRVTGIPYVATCHGFFAHKKLSRKLFPCWGVRTIAISESVRRHLIEDLGVCEKDVDMVYNGIDLEPYSSETLVRDNSLAADLGLGGQETVIGSIGRFSSVKGLKYLIEAFKEVASSRQDARLLLVGEGPEKENLMEMARNFGISGRTIITSGGKAPANYFSIIDIFCMPSVNEGLGLSMIEAMAAGKACIASDVGGLSELVNDGKDGILVPACSPKELAAAILRLAGDADLKKELSRNARRKAGGFSIEDSVARTMEVYKKVVGVEGG
jgi:glycosyltransferase involved in cell wall biosynthesis